MKTIYILITALFIWTVPSYGQIDDLLGDIMEEVQEKVGGAQEEAADTASMKAIKNKLKDILAGINGLDKYPSELKCIYVILKLAMLDQDLEAKIQNSGNCKKQYDLYGMQLMVKASYTGIGYCFDSLTELISQRADDGTLLTPELKEFFKEYEAINILALRCIRSGWSDGAAYDCDRIKGLSDLEIDFIMTVGSANLIYDFVGMGPLEFDEEGSAWRRYYILKILKDLINEYNPVAGLAKSIEIGGKMSALPCN